MGDAHQRQARYATILQQYRMIVRTLGGGRRAVPHTPNFVVHPSAYYVGVRAAPKGTPSAIVTRLNAETTRVLADAELRRAFEKEAIDIVGGTPEAFGEYLKSELAKWGKLVRASGVKVE